MPVQGVLFMSNRKKVGLYLVSALIPCGIYLITLMLLNAVPFGESSIIISDANRQYIDFAAYWKSVLSGENSLLYTFTKTLGGDGLNLAAYYLLSPVNLLFLFSNTENLPLLYTLVIIVKVSLCALAFFHASTRFYGFKASHLLFSTAYSLIAYNVVYGWNIMWLDGVIILPLLVLGLHRVLEKKAPWLYILSLMYALATNFYIGYMLCIASVIFCAAMLVLNTTAWKEKAYAFVRFGIASLISGFGAAMIWLPSFLSIAGERSQTNAFEITFERSFGLLSFPAKLFCGAASPQDIMGGLPNIFCGTVILLLVAIFFLNRTVLARAKLTAGSILLLLFASFFFLLPNTIWHGFSPTNAFNFRYSFLFSFVLIVIAQHQFFHRADISLKMVVPAAITILAVLVVSLIRKPHFLQLGDVLITLSVLILSAMGLTAGKKFLNAATIFLCAIGILELGLNCYTSYKAITDDSWTLNAKDFSSYVQNTEAAVNYVKEYDSSFYRMEKTFYRTNNDAAMFGYRGLSHFSSTEPVFTKVFMRNMGFSSYYDFWAAYTGGSTAEVDSLLGVKYLLSQDELPETKGYSLLDTLNGIHIYKNENALTIAILSESGITSVSMDTEDKFALHNAIWQGLTGQNSDILQQEDYRVTLHNITAVQTDTGNTVYQKQDPSQQASVRYEISVSQTNPLYFYFTAPEPQNVRVIINGEEIGQYFDQYSWNMDCAGTFTQGDTVIIELSPVGDSMVITQPYFYYENMENLANMAAERKQQDLQVASLSDFEFRGSFTAQSNQILLFTIPHSSGWTLKIDGQNVPLIKALDTFLAAEVTAGQHNFELRYMPPGLSIGIGLTVLAVGMALCWYLWENKYKY